METMGKSKLLTPKKAVRKEASASTKEVKAMLAQIAKRNLAGALARKAGVPEVGIFWVEI